MNERLRKQLAFVLEIDKEKNIFRQTHLSGHGRNEEKWNSDYIRNISRPVTSRRL